MAKSAKKKKAVPEVRLTKAHYHEACDRTFCIQLMIAEMLEKHPVFSQDKKLRALLDKAHDALGDAYQITDSKM